VIARFLLKRGIDRLLKPWIPSANVMHAPKSLRSSDTAISVLRGSTPRHPTKFLFVKDELRDNPSTSFKSPTLNISWRLAKRIPSA
jgi:hypothetical protein